MQRIKWILRHIAGLLSTWLALPILTVSFKRNRPDSLAQHCLLDEPSQTCLLVPPPSRCVPENPYADVAIAGELALLNLVAMIGVLAILVLMLAPAHALQAWWDRRQEPEDRREKLVRGPWQEIIILVSLSPLLLIGFTGLIEEALTIALSAVPAPLLTIGGMALLIGGYLLTRPLISILFKVVCTILRHFSRYREFEKLRRKDKDDVNKD